MEENKLQDDMLRNLMKDSFTGQPRMIFTEKVMADIHQLEVEKTKNPWFSISQILLFAIGVTVFVLLYFVVFPYLNLSFFELSFQSPDIPKLQRYFSYFNESLSGLQSTLNYIKGSTITLVLIIVIPALLVLDRMLKRLNNGTFLLF